MKFWTVFIVVVLLGSRGVVYDTFKVPSGSMTPKIVPGDHFLANPMAYGWKMPFTRKYMSLSKGPRRGEVVVYQRPLQMDETEPITYVGRVVAVPGDRVMFEGNLFMLNGKAIERRQSNYKNVLYEKLDAPEYLVKFNPDSQYNLRWEESTLGEKEYFIVGDNRDNSHDSRTFGPVMREAILARYVMRFWPLMRDEMVYK